MKKLFISCPIQGRTFENVCASIKKMHKIAEIIFDEELEIIGSPWVNELEKSDITDLARHIADMAQADYFIGIEHDDFWNTCCVEASVAMRYRIPSTYVNPRELMPDVYRVRMERLVGECL